jgi:hypothetical protein
MEQVGIGTPTCKVGIAWAYCEAGQVMVAGKDAEG